MTATLWKRLVLKLNDIGTATLKATHRALRIECIAKASVCIHDQGNLNAISELCDAFADFGKGCQTNV